MMASFNTGRGDVLNLDDEINVDSPTRSVREILNSKHPSAQPLHVNYLLPNWTNPPDFYPVVFDPFRWCVNRSAALRTTGAAGPSGADAHCWRRLCTAFYSALSELCVAIALFTYQTYLYLICVS